MSQMNLFIGPIGPGQIVWPRVSGNRSINPLQPTQRGRVCHAIAAPSRRRRAVRPLEERGRSVGTSMAKVLCERASSSSDLAMGSTSSTPTSATPWANFGRAAGAHRRPGEGRLDGLAVDLRRPEPASPVDVLLRLFLVMRRARRGDRAPCPVDETTRGQDGRAPRCGVTPPARAVGRNELDIANKKLQEIWPLSKRFDG